MITTFACFETHELLKYFFYVLDFKKTGYVEIVSNQMLRCIVIIHIIIIIGITFIIIIIIIYVIILFITIIYITIINIIIIINKFDIFIRILLYNLLLGWIETFLSVSVEWSTKCSLTQHLRLASAIQYNSLNSDI